MEPLANKINKKQVFLWTLYDFGNSIMVIAFALYFSQWLVVDRGVSDLWYNLIFVGSSILLLATAPVIGSMADKKNIKLFYLRITTVLLFLACMVSALFAILHPSSFAYVIFAAIGFLFSNYFYQFSLSFYNAMLYDLAPEDKRGRVSGMGQSANWLGQVAGIFITIPFATGMIYFFGNPGRAQTLLPATAIFFLFALPMLFWYKESENKNLVKVNLFEEYKNYWKSFKNLLAAPGLGRFLLGFFFFNDAILTMENNYAIYMQQVFNVSDKTKSFLMLGVLLASAMGAFLSGYIADKIGLKKFLMIILICWVAIFPSLGLAPNFNIFLALSLTMGLIYGSTWTVTRAILAYLTPASKLNQGFSYYSLAERFATFIGPLVWGVITSTSIHYGIWRYKIAAITLTVFIVVGMILISKIPSQPHPSNITLT